MDRIRLIREKSDLSFSLKNSLWHFFAAFGDDFWATEGCQHPAVSCEFFEVKRRLTDKRIDPHHFCVSLFSGPLWPDFLFQLRSWLNRKDLQQYIPPGRDRRESVCLPPKGCVSHRSSGNSLFGEDPGPLCPDFLLSVRDEWIAEKHGKLCRKSLFFRFRDFRTWPYGVSKSSPKMFSIFETQTQKRQKFRSSFSHLIVKWFRKIGFEKYLCK